MRSAKFFLECFIVSGIAILLLAGAVWNWLPLDTVETLGFSTGAICVWLVTRGSIWNWPIGLANNIFFGILFWNARLFADFGLQGVYFILGVYGWWTWLYGGKNKTAMTVSRATRSEWVGMMVFLVLGTWALRELLIFVNGAAPFWDALTTTLCLCAQYLLCLKKIENWYFWIVADFIYIPLYFSRDLPLTGILYSGFLILCLIGLNRWKKVLNR